MWSKRYAPRMMDRIETGEESAVVQCMQKNEVVSASPSHLRQKQQGRFSGTRLHRKYQSPGTHLRETVRRTAPRRQIADCGCVEDQRMSGSSR